jgi:hypothetical protein
MKLTKYQSAEYRKLCKEVSKSCRRSKREWLQQIAREAQLDFEKGSSRNLYKSIKTLSGKRSTKPGLGIMNEDNEMIYDNNMIKQRWYDYLEQLYCHEPVITECEDSIMKPDDPPELEPDVLLSEIRCAIGMMKDNKAPGLDDIPAELLKAGGETIVLHMKDIIDDIWYTARWPDDWCMSEVVALPKVTGTYLCNKHRTLSMISHASKVLIEIIRCRINPYIRDIVADEQFGFCPGKGTTDAIIALRHIIEKVTKRQNTQLWLMFIDYAKAFDTVNHDVLWSALLEFGVPHHLVWLLKGLYSKTKGQMRIGKSHTTPFDIGKGVRQGCILSPMLFNLCGEMIMRMVAEDLDDRKGCTIGGRDIWNLRYADDTTLIATSHDELVKQAESLRKHSLKFGLKINPAKTHMMVINCEPQTINLDGADVNCVDSFNYLGSIITNDNNSSVEIKKRIAVAKATTSKLVPIWKSGSISLQLKKQLIKALVWSVVLYGSESWTLKSSDEKRIKAFEMWAWRRLLRVSWTEHRSNDWVRHRVMVQEREGLMAQLIKRKIAKYHHWKRRSESLVLTVIEGEIEGKRKPGRMRAAWIDDIVRWTEGGLPAAQAGARRDGHGRCQRFHVD